MDSKKIVQRIIRVGAVARRLGIRGALAYLLIERCYRVISIINRRDYSLMTFPLYTSNSRFPLVCRYNTTDRSVFAQVFIEREYACVDEMSELKFIIDCGANVGYTSAYFLTRFPNAQIIAIEPDERNFEVLKRNVMPYGNRVISLHAAVWSHKARLVVCRNQYRDGGEWSTQVRECRDGERPDVVGIDVGSLLADSPFEQIDLLKVDIEQAEAVVFSRNYESWIDRVRNFVIELHDEQCSEIFFHALPSGAFKFSRSGELTVAQRVDEPKS